MAHEKKKLPSRRDPNYPEALDVHMKANKVFKYTEEDREIQRITKEKYDAEFKAVREK